MMRNTISSKSLLKQIKEAEKDLKEGRILTHKEVFGRKESTMKTVKELRGLIVKNEKTHGNEFKNFGEILCYHFHGLNMGFKLLAEHFDITLDELAEVIADHIRRL